MTIKKIKETILLRVQTFKESKEQQKGAFILLVMFIIGFATAFLLKKGQKNNYFFSANSHENSAVNFIQNPEIYAILRTLQANDSIKLLPIQNMAENLLATQENLTEDSTLLHTIAKQIDSLGLGNFCLRQEDFMYFTEQYQQKNSYKIDRDSLKVEHFIPQSEVDILENQGNLATEEVHKAWNVFFEKYGKNAYFYNISIPYFSQDRNIAIVTVRVKCGAFCGGGHKAILVKSSDKWKLLCKMYKWSS